MVSKKNFQQNGRVNPQQRQMPYKKPPLKPPMMQNFNNPMFNVSQIPDNPGYLDFNLPTPPTSANNNASGIRSVNDKSTNDTGSIGAATQQNKKKNNKNKQRNKPPAQQQNILQNGGGWKNRNQQNGSVAVANNARFNGVARNFQPMGNRRSNRLMGPMGGPRGGMGVMGPQIPPMGFQPPMIPPMPPMARGGPPIPPPMGGPLPPPFMRRGNGPLPPPIPPMLPPRMARGMPPVPFNGPITGPGKINKKVKLNKKVTKGKSTIKTLKNLINQYPLDKPWVTDEIRGEHDKKVDIENRLKGNKDDELFAQFKVQRDKFVAMYEAAREEYLKKEAAAVKAKVT